MSLRPMRSDDAPTVARLHVTHLAGLLHELGPAVAARFYRQALLMPETVALVLGEAEARGFVFGTMEADGFYRRVLRSAPLGLGLPVALRVLGRPRLLRSLLAPALPASGPELLFVALAPAHRGAGDGGRLLRAFEAELRRRGADHYELSVECANERAVAVYEHLGLQRAGDLVEFGLARRRYRKVL